MSERDELLGVDWNSVGRNIFGGVHLAGKSVLSAFGAGAAAQSLESVETGAGILPTWAQTGPIPGSGPQVDTVVNAPDALVITTTSGQTGIVNNVASVHVVGGRRFDGNGHVPGAADKFSFGIGDPVRVDVLTKTGAKATTGDVKVILFQGGTEAGRVPTQRIQGSEEMDDLEVSAIEGELAADTHGGMTCCCPHCGAPLRLCLAGGASTDGAETVDVLGFVEIVAGMRGRKRPLVAAPSDAGAACCACQCPNCGAMLCLTYKTATVAGDAEIVSGDVGYNWWDYALAIPTGGSSFVFSAGQNEYQKSQARGSAYTPGAVQLADPNRNPAYRNAQSRLAAIQARGATPSSVYTPVTPVVPSFDYAPVDVTMLGAPDDIEMIHVSDTYIYGCDVLGAAGGKAPPKKPGRSVAISAPAGKSVHKLALARAGDAVKNAKAAGTHAIARSKQYKPGKPIAVPTGIHGVMDTILGAVTGTPTYSLAQKRAVARFNGIVAKHGAAAKQAAAKGKKALDAAAKLETTRKAVAPKIQRVLPRGSTVVLGADADPNNPGYLTDGTLDPNYTGGSLTGFPGQTTYDPTTDPNLTALGPIPPTRGQPLNAAAIVAPYQAPPDNAIFYPYDSSPYNGTGGAIGSANYFKTRTDGFWWNSNANWFDAYRGGKSNHDEGAGGDMGNPEGKGGDVATNALSLKYGWGPLMGAPDSRFAGLQMAANGQWFFMPDNAQTWATQDADQALQLLAQQIQAADQAAVDADNARIAQEALQAQENQAKQDAANALAQSAADTQSTIVQQQQAAQQSAMDLQQQQIDMQTAAAQAKLDLQSQQANLANQPAIEERELQLVDLELAQLAQGGQPLFDDGQGDGGGQYDQPPAGYDDEGQLAQGARGDESEG